MEKNLQRLPYLLNRYSEGTCSREELDELFACIRRAQEDKGLYDYLRQEWEKGGLREPVPEPDWDRMFYRITEHTGGSGQQRRRTWKWAASAAAVLVLLLLGSGSYLIYRQSSQQQQLLSTSDTHKIVPGGNKAVLTLADGSRIILDSAASGMLARQGNTSIKKTNDGHLVYTSGDGREEGAAPTMNTISTPRGGQYQVNLPDGSRVWLNAESSLRFPSSFTDSDRRVELTGEAYFEIARNEAKPFLVSSGSQTVQVLGTHFNINAYPDEAGIKTTLIEGSVKVMESTSGRARLLNPGQEATTARSGEIIVNAAIPGQAIAWKNGKFMFNSESIESIMRRVARWYNVEIVYRGNAANTYFTGSVSRFADVTDVLRKLELTGTVHFKIEERRIIVMQ